MKRFRVAKMDKVPSVRCPCGQARRAFTDLEGAPVSVHLVKIQKDAKPHYHKKHTEVYVILQGRGFLELDGEKLPVEPFTAVMILPGCRHRACGDLLILNVVCPPFDPKDEFLEG